MSEVLICLCDISANAYGYIDCPRLLTKSVTGTCFESVQLSVEKVPSKMTYLFQDSKQQQTLFLLSCTTQSGRKIHIEDSKSAPLAKIENTKKSWKTIQVVAGP